MAQIDFILEMYQAEHPKDYTFTRGGQPTPQKIVSTQAQWADVLTGDSLREYMGARMPNAAVLEKLRAAHRAAMVPPPALGKKI
jgi:hypothetical protein